MRVSRCDHPLWAEGQRTIVNADGVHSGTHHHWTRPAIHEPTRGGKAPNPFIYVPDPAQVIIVQGDSFTGVPTSLPSEQNLGWGGINNPKVSRCRNVGNKPAILPWTQVSGLAIVLKGGETDEVEASKSMLAVKQ